MPLLNTANYENAIKACSELGMKLPSIRDFRREADNGMFAALPSMQKRYWTINHDPKVHLNLSEFLLEKVAGQDWHSSKSSVGYAFNGGPVFDYYNRDQIVGYGQAIDAEPDQAEIEVRCISKKLF